jgi:hypothetical protein
VDLTSVPRRCPVTTRPVAITIPSRLSSRGRTFTCWRRFPLHAIESHQHRPSRHRQGMTVPHAVYIEYGLFCVGEALDVQGLVDSAFGHAERKGILAGDLTGQFASARTGLTGTGTRTTMSPSAGLCCTNG